MGGACGEQRALISADIRFCWFLLHGEVPDTARERTKYKVQFGICVWHPLAENPTDKFRKKRKKKPGEIPSRKREEHTHTNPYLYFILVLFKKSNFC